MKNQSRMSMVVGVVIPLVLFAGLLALAGKESPTASAQTQPTSTTGNGLQTVTFDTPAARVTVKLPDDIRTGDTITGTLAVEPKGDTTDERAKNRAAVRSRMIRLMLTRVRKPGEAPTTKPATLTVPLSGGDTSTVKTLRGRANETRIEFTATAPGDFALAPEVYKMAEAELGSAVIPIDADAIKEAGPKADPKLAPKFIIPPLGQTGRPVVITGPFDGKGSNTDVKLTAPPKPFIKISAREPDVDLPVIAESPRKAVIEFPQDIIGQARITVTDGRTQTSAPFRNVGVNLTAPKTSLLKGESTELRVQITGLEGIKAPVPLTLTCTGVITMQGGIYQPLMIQPSEVRPDGTYSTTRTITGVQAGGWGATATVMVHKFDACLQDDSATARRILWNTFNGDYIFINPLPPPKPVQPPPPTSLTGTGKIIMKGCILTLTHNAPDRRVMSRLDACTNSGNATIETVTPKLNFTIQDRNIADNTTICQ